MNDTDLQNTHGARPEDADELARAFEAAGERIAASLEGAARRGELSFSDMAESILKDLARLAITEAVDGVFGGLLGGNAPAGGRSSQTINLNITGAADAAGFRKSGAQIGAHLARAVRSGAGRI